MADDRLFIKCRACGKRLFLGKMFSSGNGFYWDNYGREPLHLEDRLNQFYEDHYMCRLDFPVDDDTDGPWYGDFQLEYEFFDMEVKPKGSE